MTRINPIFKLLTVLSISLLLQACSPPATPTPFLPPARPLTAPPPATPAAQELPILVPTILVDLAPATPTPTCTDGLSFIADNTIPDGTIVQPGATIVKEWLVKNSGSCNWDSRYLLKLVSGLDMGAKSEQALYPARSGTQAVIRITFIAPLEPGNYGNGWQTYGPAGEAFGDTFFMQIIVQPQAQLTLEVVQ